MILLKANLGSLRECKMEQNFLTVTIATSTYQPLRERTLALNSRSIIAHYCDDALAAINIRAWMMRVSTHTSRKCECSPPGVSLLLDPFLIHKRWAAVYKRVTFRNLWGFGAFSQCGSIVSR